MAWARRIFNSLKSHWPRTHAAMAPFGAALAALLLSVHAGNGKWQFWHSWDELADMIGLGAVMYGMAVLTLEGGLTVMFWALDERDKRRERERARREEEMAHREKEARKKARNELLNDIITELRQSPDSDPVAVVEQMREEARNGQDQR